MTTFTTDDREEEYKKIVAAAPNQPGYEDAIPIPFAGLVTLTDTAPVFKDLTDSEIREVCNKSLAPKDGSIFTFARAILRKAQEK